MGNIESCFRKSMHPLLIAFLVSGDPDPQIGLEAARAVINGGADILELGVPYSDPIADGRIIQRAHLRALSKGAGMDSTFALVREIRRQTDIPVVLLLYYNLVMQRGVDRFYLEAKDAGVDGVIVVDMPPEESGEALTSARRAGIDEIFLVTETTSEERLRLILSMTDGFVYLVSSLGVTGVRETMPPKISGLIARVKSAGSLPVALGFGISGPEHAREAVLAGADGIIVGSAIVNRLEEHLNDPGSLFRNLQDFVSSIKGAMISAR
ncbi:MAG: tryptophan synthase subunit alpha [Methanomicrobiales archaeon]|nr:tryptophan synthase subunit alpha [Methanomicrobiales archaeon]